MDIFQYTSFIFQMFNCGYIHGNDVYIPNRDDFYQCDGKI